MGSVLPVYRLQCFRAVTGGVNHRREEGKDGGGREKGGKGNGLWFRASASRVWGEDGSRRRSDFSRKSRETTCENIAVPALVAPGPRSLAGGPGPRFVCARLREAVGVLPCTLRTRAAGVPRDRPVSPSAPRTFLIPASQCCPAGGASRARVCDSLLYFWHPCFGVICLLIPLCP